MTAAPPTPEAHLREVRSKADRTLAFLLVLHLPPALGLAPLHGTWMAAILVGLPASGCAPTTPPSAPSWPRWPRRSSAAP